MLVRQYMHTNPIASSYLFGCGNKASGVVVAPLQ